MNHLLSYNSSRHVLVVLHLLRLWHSCQRGRLRYQRTRIRFQASATFNVHYLLLTVCRNTKIEKKSPEMAHLKKRFCERGYSWRWPTFPIVRASFSTKTNFYLTFRDSLWWHKTCHTLRLRSHSTIFVQNFFSRWHFLWG